MEKPNNLQYVSEKTRAFVEELLDSYSVHFFTQEIITKGLRKDPVDAVHDVQLALDALKMVADDTLEKEKDDSI